MYSRNVESLRDIPEQNNPPQTEADSAEEIKYKFYATHRGTRIPMDVFFETGVTGVTLPWALYSGIIPVGNDKLIVMFPHYRITIDGRELRGKEKDLSNPYLFDMLKEHKVTHVWEVKPDHGRHVESITVEPRE